MPRKAKRTRDQRDLTSFEESGGSPARAYVRWKLDQISSPGKNRSNGRAWRGDKDYVSVLLKKIKVDGLYSLERWELLSRQSWFYEGSELLVELERLGRIKLPKGLA